MMSNVFRTTGGIILLSILLCQLSGCGKSIFKWKTTPGLEPKAQDAAKSFSSRLTFPPLAGEIYVINPDFSCPKNVLASSNTLLSRIFSGEDLPVSDQAEPQTLNFRKSFQTQNQFGVLETFWVDFLFPTPVFKRLYQATPSDQLQRLYQALLFLSIPVPNRVSTYFFSKNHLITTQAEFFWANRTYLLLFLFREYHNLYLTLKASLPPKSEVIDFLSSLPMSPADRAFVDRYLTFSDLIPSVMTLSLVLGCHQQVLVHGRPPPCDFLYQHMSTSAGQPPVTLEEHASYACPVQKFMRGSQRITWNYLCAQVPESTCPGMNYQSFDPNDPYLKFHIHFYAKSPPKSLFCPISQDPEGPVDLAIVMDSAMENQYFECNATTLERLQTTYLRATQDTGSFPYAKTILDSIFPTWEVSTTYSSFDTLFGAWDANKYATTRNGATEEAFLATLPDVTTPANVATHGILSRMAQAGEGVLAGNYSLLGPLLTSLNLAAGLENKTPENILSVITTDSLPAPSPSPSPDIVISDGGDTSGAPSGDTTGSVVTVAPSPSPSPDTATSDGGETSSSGTTSSVVTVAPSPSPSPDIVTSDGGETSSSGTTGSVVTVAPSPSPSPDTVISDGGETSGGTTVIADPIPSPSPSPMIVPYPEGKTPGVPETPTDTPTPTPPPKTPGTPTTTPPPETPLAGNDSPDQHPIVGAQPAQHCVIHPEPPYEVIDWWVIP